MKPITAPVRRAVLSIAAKLYLSNIASLAAVAILVISSVHFATRTKTAASDLVQSGVLELQRESELEILFQQHRRLVQAAPAELDRSRLQLSQAAVERTNVAIKRFLAEAAANQVPIAEPFLATIGAELPRLQQASAEVFMLAHNFAQDQALHVSQDAYGEVAERIAGSLKNWRNVQLASVDHELVRLSGAARTLTVWVSLSGLAAFISIGPVGLWLKYRILSRLGSLTAIMLRLSRKETSVEIPFTTSRDEIGDFARATEVFKNNAIALATAHLHLDAAVNNMTQGLSMYDADQNLVLCNDRFVEIYGLSPDLVKLGTSLRQIFDYAASFRLDKSRSVQELFDDYCAKRAKTGSRHYQREFGDGRTIAVSQRVMPGGGWVDTHEDISERIKAERQIAHMALFDGLTDLPNRFQFQRRLVEALETATDSAFAVLFLDLDGFKNVNDTLGHPDGDELLRQVAARLGRCVGDKGLVSRLGGDEFAILQQDLAAPDAITGLASRIIAALSQPYDLNGHQAIVGASIGIALFPDDGRSADQLLMNADIALYGAKAQGRGTFRYFEPEMDARMKSRRSLELDLWNAVEEESFEVYYQPVIGLAANGVRGFEALLRWRHPGRGMVSPADFIPLAEETGLIVRLGEWVLRRACREAAGWPRDIRIAVNLSPVQFRTAGLAQAVFSALATSHLDASRLELEITEAVLLQDSPVVLQTLHQLKDFGVRIAMDDFGTGYSSLSYLRSFPFDKIKIDQSFVRGLGSAGDSVPIIRAVTGLGTDLGMTTTAEGVETREQLEILRTQGCNEVQGYLFSPAVPAGEIADLLARLKRDFMLAA
jgi:diguanylate cyclase (GGDEF)-like protein/PAS domain S-box-containing protein